MPRKYVKKGERVLIYRVYGRPKDDAKAEYLVFWNEKGSYKLYRYAFGKDDDGNLFIDFPAGADVSCGDVVKNRCSKVWKRYRWLVVGVEQSDDKVRAKVLVSCLWWADIGRFAADRSREKNSEEESTGQLVQSLLVPFFCSLPSVTRVDESYKADGLLEVLIGTEDVRAGDRLVLSTGAGTLVLWAMALDHDKEKAARAVNTFFWKCERWSFEIKEVADAPCNGFKTVKAAPLSYKMANNDAWHDVFCKKSRFG